MEYKITYTQLQFMVLEGVCNKTANTWLFTAHCKKIKYAGH